MGNPENQKQQPLHNWNTNPLLARCLIWKFQIRSKCFSNGIETRAPDWNTGLYEGVLHCSVRLFSDKLHISEDQLSNVFSLFWTSGDFEMQPWIRTGFIIWHFLNHMHGKLWAPLTITEHTLNKVPSPMCLKLQSALFEWGPPGLEDWYFF